MRFITKHYTHGCYFKTDWKACKIASATIENQSDLKYFPDNLTVVDLIAALTVISLLGRSLLITNHNYISFCQVLS